MWFGVLGPIEVRHGDQEVAVGRRKERAVLALLLAAANRTVALDRIVDTLWGDEPPDQAISSLHAYISNLRRRLEPDRPPRSPASRLVTRPPGYALVVEPEEVDAHLFESIVADSSRVGRAGDLREAERLMTEALNLWRGPAYGEFGDEPFAIPEVVRLEELRAATIEDRMEIRLALGMTAVVVAEAEALVSASPTRERAWGHLMLGLYQSGRQTEALQAYQRCRLALAEQSGVDPGIDLQRLEGRILAQDPDLLRSRHEVLAAVPASSVGEPPSLTTGTGSGLIGRHRELEQLDRLADATVTGHGQVVLVSGEAGVGKSTLVAELAERVRQIGFAVAMTRWPETLDRPALAPWYAVLEQLGHEDDDIIGPVQAAIVDSRTPTVSGLVGQIVDTVIGHANQRPVLLVCDDVQWAEELSHDLIRRLSEQAQSAPLLIALVQRHPATDEQPGLIETLATLARLPYLSRINVGGLAPDDMIEMIRQATQILPSASVGASIHEQTGGNAFYALELGRLLGAEGDLTSTDDLGDLGVPTSVRDVIRRRLSRLPDQAVTVLGIAAVLGSEVEPLLLQRVAAVDLETVADQLDLAEASGFLRRHPTRIGRYRFAHELVRAAIVDAMPGLHAARLHARSIDAIVEIHGEDDARVVHRLARHAVAAVEVLGGEQAARRLNRSALAYRAMLDLDRTLETFHRALEMTDEMPTSTVKADLQAELTMRVGQAEFLIRGLDAKIEARFDRALDLARHGSIDARVVALSGIGTHLLLWGRVVEAIEVGEELLSFGLPEDSVATGNGLYLTGFKPVVDPHATVDRSILDRPPMTGPVVKWTTWLAGLGLVEIVTGQSEVGTERVVDAARQALSDHTADAWELAWTLAFSIASLVLAGDATAVEEIADRLPQRSEGVAIVDGTVDGGRAWARAMAGDGAALGDLAQARAGLRDRGEMLFWLFLTLAHAELALAVNSDRDAAATIVAEATAMIEQRGLRGLQPWCAELEGRLVRR